MREKTLMEVEKMVALGADHGGYLLKQEIKKYLEEKQIPYQDMELRRSKEQIIQFMQQEWQKQFKTKNVIQVF